ncbi:hypothetical protein QFC21_003619 [Naganishia friedmannii]|uniref:Uncharacterized protein n=1 Tax=Naganishia friedmannii TaxID=89922 RepID=A0ACC2VNV6_9TREE|nr:hypothetical protein QFC21_003619 [Naganishia friedmannii]
MCFYRSFQTHLLQSLAIVEPLFITVDSFSRQLYVLPREQYLPQLDGSRTLLVPHRGRISRVRIEPVPQELYESHRKYFLKPASTTTATSTQSTSATTLQAGIRPKRLGANKDFVRQLRAILRIVLPRWLGKEGFLLALHTFFLIFRTVLSVAVAKLDGRIVRDLVNIPVPLELLEVCVALLTIPDL